MSNDSLEAPGSREQARPPSALRHRDFALLWSGQTISVAGNGIFTVALPLEVLSLTGSSVDLSIVVSARLLPTVLLLLVGGSLVDRLSRRLVMLVSDAVSGASVSALAVLIALHQARLWEFVVLAVILGTASAFFMPASTAIARDVLPSELLVSASSLTSLSQSLGQYLAGPLAGGLAVAFLGNAWTFGIDGISFFASGLCLAAMRHVKETATSESALLAGIGEGLRYCRSQRWLWWSFIAVGIANLVSFVPLNTVLAPLMAEHVFGGGAVLLGFMYAANGAGGALASYYVKRRGAPQRRLLTILLVWAGAGVAAMLAGLSPQAWMATVFLGASWFCVTYGNVLWFPLMQEEVPPELLGRVSSVDWLLSLALSPLGTLAGGAVAGVAGIRLTVIVGGAMAAATAGVVLLPGVREPDQRVRAAPREV